MRHSIAVWLLVAALVGLVLGYRGQRRPTRHGGAWRGLGAALLGTGLLLVAGFARLHLPLQPADAVAYSEARARAYLRTLPIHVDLDDEDDHDRERHNAAIEAHREALRAAVAMAPRACTDWGLRRVRVADRFDTCVEFDDGVGGTYSLCVHDDLVRYGQEPPA